MRYHALAVDYDGTIAWHGTVDQATIDALNALKNSGRKLLLVTGRELPDLFKIFPQPEIFDRIVAENGALLYRPASREEIALAEPPPRSFVDLLRKRGVQPLSVGRVIVATFEPNEGAVLECIREAGLELQVIFNKGAVMVLPSGVNKATGLLAALDDLGLSPHNVVGVGDAENDHAFLDLCECSVAVDNALPALKEKTDWIAKQGHGAGVSEVISQLIENDFNQGQDRFRRRRLVLGTDAEGREISIDSYGCSFLIAGTSGGGKSTFTTSFIERLFEQNYQACIIDPEGDYGELDEVLTLGDATHAAPVEEVLKALEKPRRHLVVNLLGVPLQDRPTFFQGLLTKIQELRARSGRPHWFIVDETHHVMPETWAPTPNLIPTNLPGLVMVTVHPNSISKPALELADLILAIGAEPNETIAEFCQVLGIPAPERVPVELQPGEALAWRKGEARPVFFKGNSPKATRRRHIRKYAKGELSPEESFYFEGPDKKLHLRAQNLQTFLQLAEGVDDATWLHHLRRGDYSKWFANCIKDDELAAEMATIERSEELSAEASLERVKEAIEARYTAPA